MLRLLSHGLWIAVLSLTLQTGCEMPPYICRERRCLVEKLIEKAYLSQPQEDECKIPVSVPFLEYQTLAVDTKKLRLYSRLQASLEWDDKSLAWDMEDYYYDKVVLPVNKVWTPELHVTNGIKTHMKHSSQDLLVYNNGTVKHSVTINAEVNCEVNMFNYPFAADLCPVALETWAEDGCGTSLKLGKLKVITGTQGDWQTKNGSIQTQTDRDDRKYIWVDLRIKFLNPFITLMLPSILILLADATSFALPLGGGERNSFKVTLVLSFTMFLVILNNELPGDGQCSPIIRTHFCICLILLVVSMLVSLVLTRVAKDGGIILSPCIKMCCSKKIGKEEETEDEEVKADIEEIQLSASEAHSQMLRKVVNFLEDCEAKEKEEERCHRVANVLDNIFFWIYFIFGIIYFIAMIGVMVKYSCTVNHFEFWY